ncbi:MAG: hypothetical protein LBI61_02000 [Puniceicoccales bacterium]|jgi:hypothetical protein|nr:hypothetical protein [Puniceicoccales bacterium]
MKDSTESASKNWNNTANRYAAITIDAAKMRALVLSQLRVASPASLPVAVIFRGVCCECERVGRGDVEEILRALVASNAVVKISECGFGDRFMAADGCAPENAGIDG